MGKKKDGEKSPPKRGLSGEDRTLWNFVTRSIRPLPGRRETPVAENFVKPAAEKRAAPPPIQPFTPDIRLKDAPASAASGEGGIDRRTLEKLRRGQLPLEGFLDLHGLRQGEAQAQLTRFLTDGYHAGRRCVLVITGKGSRNGEAGILRRMVPMWLEMPPLSPMILSHCQARQKDGGDGAFYVLLRRKR
jgi:DNA-nicking Smr family endonuclease